jgi:thiol-disulfide isomerase/thioredoxin
MKASLRLGALFLVAAMLLGTGFTVAPLLANAKAPALQTLPEAVNPKTGQFVLLDFYAKWCSTCQQLAPQVNALAEKKKVTLQVIHVDVDKAINGELSQRYDITSTPTYILFSPSGKPVYQMRDRLSLPVLQKVIEANVAKCKSSKTPC